MVSQREEERRNKNLLMIHPRDCPPSQKRSRKLETKEPIGKVHIPIYGHIYVFLSE
jgi:hypothetical protein